MTIAERLAWVHQAATTLNENDLVELKFNLKSLITEATEALEAVRAEIRTQRKQRPRMADRE